MSGSGPVIFESTRIGTYMKVTAVHEASGTEVSVLGPASATGQSALRGLALRKLEYVLSRRER